MAGDIGIREEVIVLTEGASPSAARAVVARTHAKALHSYGTRVLIAAAPADEGPRPRGAVADAVVESEAGAVPEDVVASLDDVERMGLEAFALRQSRGYLEAKSARPHAGEEWDSGAADRPACHDITGEADGFAEARSFAGAPTSARLTGKVAVGIVMVEGPTSALKFTAAERTKVVAEVQNGLGWLGGQSPTAVTFHYDVRVVTLTVSPGPDSLTSAQKEALWRDPAMQKMGFGAGMAGVTAYVEGLRTKLGTGWAYCAFFTKYPVGHFAYASIGGPRMVMQYANDGWGPDNIDRVFAHETGHIFGAPDEYAASGCGCGGSWGHYGKPNGNCANCAPGGGVACIMKQNSWEMCAFTPYHLGFPLVQQTYTGVWRSGTDPYYLWVNASWASFKAKWEELAKLNLRLVDLQIADVAGQEKFYGAWRGGTGAHYLWVNATWASFKSKWEELAKLNLRLVDIEVKQTAAGLRYSGVWLPGTGAHYLWVNATWASFKAKWEELAPKGLRLHDVKIVSVGGVDRYFGVWRAGTGAHYLWVNATWASFKAKWEELAPKGLRLVDVEVKQTAAGPRYTGVWLPGTDAHYLWANASWQSFKAKWEELAGKGLRLVDFDVLTPAGVSLAPEAGAEEPADETGEERLWVRFGGLADQRPAARPSGVAFAGRRSRAVAEAPDEGGDGEGGGDLGAAAGAGDSGEDGYGGGSPGDEPMPPGVADGEGGGDLGPGADDGRPADGEGGGSFAGSHELAGA